MRENFQQQLKNLQHDLVQMGHLAEEMIAQFVLQFEQGQFSEQDAFWQHRQQIETYEKKIERLCIKLLLQQQPVAEDLRLISAVLKMVYDVKRIGHQASEINELLTNNALQLTAPVEILLMMIKQAKFMLAMCLDAFVLGDREKASLVAAKDDEIDQAFVIMKESLITSSTATNNC